MPAPQYCYIQRATRAEPEAANGCVGHLMYVKPESNMPAPHESNPRHQTVNRQKAPRPSACFFALIEFKWSNRGQMAKRPKRRGPAAVKHTAAQEGGGGIKKTVE